MAQIFSLAQVFPLVPKNRRQKLILQKILNIYKLKTGYFANNFLQKFRHFDQPSDKERYFLKYFSFSLQTGTKIYYNSIYSKWYAVRLCNYHSLREMGNRTTCSHLKNIWRIWWPSIIWAFISFKMNISGKMAYQWFYYYVIKKESRWSYE